MTLSTCCCRTSFTFNRILRVTPIVGLLMIAMALFFVGLQTIITTTTTLDVPFLDHVLSTPIITAIGGGLSSSLTDEDEDDDDDDDDTTITSPTSHSSSGKSIHSSKTTMTKVTIGQTSTILPDSVKIAHRNDFQHGHLAIPPPLWDVVENTTCVTHPNPSDPKQQQQQSSSSKSWEQRIPYVMILGTQKGGTTALAQYLYKYPQIFNNGHSKEMHFFSDKWDTSLTKQQQQQLSSLSPLTTTTGGIHQEHALMAYRQLLNKELFGNKKQNGFRTLTMEQIKYQYPSLHILDATPNYMFASDRVPSRIMCVCPWVKLIIILRNPIDRAFSQYQMQRSKQNQRQQQRRKRKGQVPSQQQQQQQQQRIITNNNITFEQYINYDLNVLQDIGIIQQQQQQQQLQDIEASWNIYTKLGLNAPIGRGLYVIQIYQLLQAMKQIGKKQSYDDHHDDTGSNGDLLILQSEQLLTNPATTYQQVLEFLQLNSTFQLDTYKQIHTSKTYNNKNAAADAAAAVVMDPITRQKLKQLYDPFNIQLTQLLSLPPEWLDAWE